MSVTLRPKQCPICKSEKLFALRDSRPGGLFVPPPSGNQGWGCDTCGTLFSIEPYRTRAVEAASDVPSVPAGDGGTLNEMRDQVLALQAKVMRLEQDRDLHREQLVGLHVRQSTRVPNPAREDDAHPHRGFLEAMDQAAGLIERAGVTRLRVERNAGWQVTGWASAPGAPDITVQHSGESLGRTVLLVVSDCVKAHRER